MAVPVEQLSIKSTTSSGLVALGSAKAALGDRLGQIINVKTDFGATGNGSTDDRAAIQAAIDAAFGPAGSPHGTTNRFLNRPVYFPAGNYKITSPLYFTNVVGGWIFGAGSEATIIFYSGSLVGNTVAPATSGSGFVNANQITPIFMTNGFSYSIFENISLAFTGTNTNSTCFYLFQDGTQGSSTTITFSNVNFGGAKWAFLAGYQSSGLCSECTYVNCYFNSSEYGLEIVSGNALNHNVFGGGAHDCTVCAFSIDAGQIDVIAGASLAANTIDFNFFSTSGSIIGGRTESTNCLAVGGPGMNVTVSGFIYQGGSGGTFLKVIYGAARVVLQGVDFVDPGGSAKIIDFGSQDATVIMDGCCSRLGPGSATISGGSSVARLYIRGCIFGNLSVLSAFTGIVAEYDAGATIVASLPTASAAFKGVRMSVTDSSIAAAGNFGSSAFSSGGANIVPVWCDGTNWRIG